MATKHVELPDIGVVHLYKRKGLRSIRLSIAAGGQVRVSLPYWLPYEAGLSFVRTKRNWILAQAAAEPPAPIMHGQAIGKSHHVYFCSVADGRVSARISGTAIRVHHPASQQPSDMAVQTAAEAACIRALRTQASALLPQRLATLAQAHDLTYRSIKIKRLTGRWGSCDAEKNIVLNLFLMQLPWHLIDYVLLHELTHTEVLHHGADFWHAFEHHLPRAKDYRREIRDYRPAIRA